MGREIKRVPFDFDWPIGQVWVGYMFSICNTISKYVKDSPRNCEICKQFAHIVGLNIAEHGCPELPSKLEVPIGEGYQLWETTSEGSPISPVFATPEELAKWLFENKISTFGGMTTTYENWLEFIKNIKWSFSVAFDGKSLKSGVDFLVKNKKDGCE
jgi:hypothetical protein